MCISHKHGHIDYGVSALFKIMVVYVFYKLWEILYSIKKLVDFWRFTIDSVSFIYQQLLSWLICGA